MKKTFALLLSLLMLLSLALPLRVNADEEALSGELSVQAETGWMDYYQAAVDRLMEKYPDVKINLIETGAFDHLDVIDATDAGNPDVADLFAIPADRLYGLHKNEVLGALDAEKLADAIGGWEDFDAFNEGIGGKFQISGEYFAFPMNIETLINFVNIKNAEEKGIDLEKAIELNDIDDSHTVLLPIFDAWYGVAATNSANVELLGREMDLGEDVEPYEDAEEEDKKEEEEEEAEESEEAEEAAEEDKSEEKDGEEAEEKELSLEEIFKSEEYQNVSAPEIMEGLFSDMTLEFSELAPAKQELFTSLYDYWKKNFDDNTALFDPEAGWGYIDDTFTTGNGGVIRLGGPWDAATIVEQAGGGDNLKILPITSLTINGRPLRHWKGGWGLAINSRIEDDPMKVAIAEAMIEELLNPDYAIDFYKAAGKIMENVDPEVYAKSDELEDIDKVVIAAVFESYKAAPARPLFEEWGQVWDTWKNAILSWNSVQPENAEAAYAELKASFDSMMQNFVEVSE